MTLDRGWDGGLGSDCEDDGESSTDETVFHSVIEDDAFETSLRCNHVMYSLSCTIIR